jgi:ParB-like nuclease domain
MASRPTENQPAPAARSMRIADIVIGRRHRTDLGDVEGLVRSISEVGLLHPIVVRADGTLIAGVRRLEAVRKLGWEHVPVTVVELVEIVRGEHAENVERKDFTLSEAVAIRRELEPLEAAAAKKRQGTRTDKHGGKLPQGSVGKTRDKVAKFTGFGARTLKKAEAVVAAAEVDPEKFGTLKQDMDRTGRVDGSFKRLKIMRQAEATGVGRAATRPHKNAGPRPTLNSQAWLEVTPQERFRFIDNVGVAAIENVLNAVKARYEPMPGFAKLRQAWEAASEADRERVVEMKRSEIVGILKVVPNEALIVTETKARRGL